MYQVPEKIPVYTELADGSHVRGVTYRGDGKNGSHHKEFPGGIIHRAEGSYEIEMYTWSTHLHSSNHIFEYHITDSDFAEIYEEPPPTRNRRSVRGGSTFIKVYNHAGAPGTISENDMNRSIEIALDRYRNLLKDDTILATFEFSWQNLGFDPQEGGTIAFSSTVQTTQSYSLVRNGILNTFAANPNDSDFFENGLYNNFPMGSFIEYARQGNPTDNTNAIKITWPLRTKLIGAGNSSNLQIVINADMPGLDVDPSDGIAGIDLTGTLIHEIGHHLGFISHVEVLDNFFEDAITVWDIFRMHAGLGSVSPTEFFGQRRELRETEEANAALQLNSGLWTPGLSTGDLPNGDGNQSSHWKDDVKTGIFVGIMDPTAGIGTQVVNGKYIQDADIRAFDVMGYGIDSGDFMPVQVPVINSPDGVEVDPALPLELDWTPQPGSISSDILIYDLGTTIAAIEPDGPTQTLVFRQNDVTGGQLTIPLSELTLLPGHQYQWHAAV